MAQPAYFAIWWTCGCDCGIAFGRWEIRFDLNTEVKPKASHPDTAVSP